MGPEGGSWHPERCRRNAPGPRAPAQCETDWEREWPSRLEAHQQIGSAATSDGSCCFQSACSGTTPAHRGNHVLLFWDIFLRCSEFASFFLARRRHRSWSSSESCANRSRVDAVAHIGFALALSGLQRSQTVCMPRFPHTTL